MATLAVQRIRGLAAPAVVAATAGGDTTDLDPAVKLRVVIGATATVVTMTPVGPYVGTTPAKVTASLTNTTIDPRTWDYPTAQGSAKYGCLNVTYSQVVGVSVGAYTVEGG